VSELDWKPLANQDKHEPPWCDHCNDYCSPSDGSCRCCLEVDLADHKSANEKLGERVFVAENAIANVRDLHRVVIDFAASGEEVEHCEECGYVGVDGEDCPTLKALGEVAK